MKEESGKRNSAQFVFTLVEGFRGLRKFSAGYFYDIDQDEESPRISQRLISHNF